MLPDKLQLEFASLPENIHLVEKFVEDICDQFNINNTYFGNILIALTEAVNNAIEHGNKKDPSKKVTVLFESKAEGLSFTVCDEGFGFDPNAVPDPTDLKNNPENYKGRGIFLIKHLSDKINFKDGGRKTEIIFRIASINNELACERIKQLKLYSAQNKVNENLI